MAIRRMTCGKKYSRDARGAQEIRERNRIENPGNHSYSSREGGRKQRKSHPPDQKKGGGKFRQKYRRKSKRKVR